MAATSAWPITCPPNTRCQPTCGRGRGTGSPRAARGRGRRGGSRIGGDHGALRVVAVEAVRRWLKVDVKVNEGASRGDLLPWGTTQVCCHKREAPGLPESYQYLIMIKNMDRDPSLDSLLSLDGMVLVLDPETRHWVKIVARRVPVSEAKPHGLDYSLTLHGPDGMRLVGFDNAHPVRRSAGPGGKAGNIRDHKHRLETVQPYAYRDAGTLLDDFWSEVRAILRERGLSL